MLIGRKIVAVDFIIVLFISLAKTYKKSHKWSLKRLQRRIRQRLKESGLKK